MDKLDEEFEAEFQAFVARGGLDETRSVNQTYELMRRLITCPHDELRSRCPLCFGTVIKDRPPTGS